MAATTRRLTAFEGTTHLVSGDQDTVRGEVLAAERRGAAAAILIFDDTSGEQVDIDLRQPGSPVPNQPGVGTPEPSQARRAGRPKLGVIGREVTLLPRHWEWLAAQPGGASVALRRIVDEARKANADKDLRRSRQNSAYRFMSAIAGNLAGFEAAVRSLFADDLVAFGHATANWPRDVRVYAEQLARGDEIIWARKASA